MGLGPCELWMSMCHTDKEASQSIWDSGLPALQDDKPSQYMLPKVWENRPLPGHYAKLQSPWQVTVIEL